MRYYQSNGSPHLEHFSLAIQSNTRGPEFPPNPGPTTLVPQWGHRMRPARKKATPISNNGDTFRLAHCGGMIRSSKANSGNMLANIRNAMSDFLLGLTASIHITLREFTPARCRFATQTSL
jgi:hypothetical protein